MNKKLLVAIICGVLMYIGTPVFAAISDQDFASLKADFVELMQRVNALEAENAELRKAPVVAAATSPAQNPASSRTDNIRWKGDFRYRYEGINVEDEETRNRNRIRARYTLIADLPQNVEVGIGMATGGDDPVSTNQTLGNVGSTKDVHLNLAYFNWAAVENINVIGGKFKNIWVRPDNNELLWDSDYNPEGFAFIFDNGRFFVNGGLNWLESDSKTDNSRFAWGLQSGITGNLGDNTFKAGVAYFEIPVQGREVFFGDEDAFFGNSFTCVDPVNLLGCTYDHNFEDVELFAELRTSLGDMPLTLFADYAQNLDTNHFNTAWAAGARIGKASDSGTWQAAYRYQDIEADSLFGLTVGSDFAGGGTDSKGHIFSGSYAINKSWKLALTYFVTERNGDLGATEDYDRIMIDTKFKF
ncbi:MAG: putative porin [Pseudomonadales bacterium]